MKFKPLYKLDAKGKVREWSIEVESINGKIFLKTSNGLRDGKKIIHRTEVKLAKSKNTVIGQAEAEALSRWKKKKDDKLYTENLPTMKKDKKLRPMLAQSYNKDKKYTLIEEGRVNGQAKLDGTRALLYYKDGKVIMESRNGIIFFSPVVEHITSIFDNIYKNKKCDNIVFDGEIYIHNSLSFQKTQGLLRLKKGPIPEEKKKKIKTLKYHIFDLINLKDLNMSYENRYKLLETFKPLFKGTSVVIEPLIPIKSKKDIQIVHNKLVKEGYEGLMLKNMDAPYELDKRSKHLLKVKMFKDDEFKIVGFTKEDRDGKPLVVWTCVTKKGDNFNVRPKGTEAERHKLYTDAKDYIGHWLTVKYFELTDDGKPRFPVGLGIRYDK